MAERTTAVWTAALLLLLSLGLPWTTPSLSYTPGSGPTCIADLSGEGGLICDYISVGGYSTVVAGLSGSQSPARVFLVLALVLTLWALARQRPGALGPAAVAALVAVGLGLPMVLSGQVVAAGAAVLLLWATRRAQGVLPSAASSRSGAGAAAVTGSAGANLVGRSRGPTSSGR